MSYEIIGSRFVSQFISFLDTNEGNNDENNGAETVLDIDIAE